MAPLIVVLISFYLVIGIIVITIKFVSDMLQPSYNKPMYIYKKDYWFLPLYIIVWPIWINNVYENFIGHIRHIYSFYSTPKEVRQFMHLKECPCLKCHKKQIRLEAGIPVKDGLCEKCFNEKVLADEEWENCETKVLIVDMQLSNIESFELILSAKNYCGRGFQDGVSALAEFKKGEYDIAFVDIRGIGMDGFELIKRLKEIDRDMPVVVVTAYVSEESIKSAFDSGAMEYLRKPFLLEEIYSLIDRAKYLKSHRDK